MFLQCLALTVGNNQTFSLLSTHLHSSFILFAASHWNNKLCTSNFVNWQVQMVCAIFWLDAFCICLENVKGGGGGVLKAKKAPINPNKKGVKLTITFFWRTTMVKQPSQSARNFLTSHTNWLTKKLKEKNLSLHQQEVSRTRLICLYDFKKILKN